MKHYLDCRKLNEIFGVDGSDFIEIDEIKGSSGCDGELNPFYGKKHTEETKQILKERTLKLCENEKFRMSRANYGEKNGMYGSSRFGDLNPMYGKKQSTETKRKIQEKALQRYSEGFVNPLLGTKKTESQKKQIAEKNSKTFELKNPTGEIIKIKNLEEYCRKNNLNSTMMSRVARGIAKSHKGFTKP